MKDGDILFTKKDFVMPCYGSSDKNFSMIIGVLEFSKNTRFVVNKSGKYFSLINHDKESYFYINSNNYDSDYNLKCNIDEHFETLEKRRIRLAKEHLLK